MIHAPHLRAVRTADVRAENLEPAPRASGRRIVSALRPKIRVRRALRQPRDDCYVQVGGADGTRGFGITIGLGRDGRVAATILNSIHLHA